MHPEFMRAFNAHWPAVFPVRLLIAITAIWLCAALASVLLRSSSAALKHRLWAVSIAAALLMPLLVLILPEWRLGMIHSEPQGQIVADARRPAQAPVVTSYAEAAGSSEEPDRAPVNRSRFAAPVEAEPHNSSPIQAAPPLVSANPNGHQTTTIVAQHRRSFSLSWLIFLAWAIPALWLGVRMILTRKAVSHLIRETSPADDRWQTAFARLCERHGTPQPRLRVSELALTPLCLGMFRPTILVPAGGADWDDMRIGAVLTHELAHVTRRDVLWQTLAQLSCALYWFHPLTWVAQWRMRIEREIACDDRVVAGSQPAIPYAQWLLDLATALNAQPRHRRITSAGVAMANDANLEHRVRAILDARRVRGRRSRVG